MSFARQPRIPGSDLPLRPDGVLDYLWYIPYRVYQAIMYPPSKLMGLVMTRYADIAAWIQIWIQFLQMLIGVSFFTFGLLYLITASVYTLTYLGAMHIAFICTTVPMIMIMIFTEHGIRLMNDPRRMTHKIHTWHPGMVEVLAEVGEVYGTLIISTTMIVFTQIYDLVMNGVAREFVTLQNRIAYHFVGVGVGLTMWVVSSTMYSRATCRLREVPAIDIKEHPTERTRLVRA